jgi:hypothetical protein
MPTKVLDITTLTRGNDVVLKFTVKTTVDLASAKFTVKRSFLNADSVAAVAKVVTVNLTADGQITDVGGADDLAMVQIILAKADTAAIQADLDYVWDLEVFDATVKATTPVGGRIFMHERVRKLMG